VSRITSRCMRFVENCKFKLDLANDDRISLIILESYDEFEWC
jgi:hypothetical protein